MTFQVAKDSRDRLRLVQRDLRDHFTAQAEQLKRSLQESQQAAERAVKASRSEREARLAEITAALEQLETVRRQARALLPQPAPARDPESEQRTGGAGGMTGALTTAARRVLLLAIDAHRDDPAATRLAARPAGPAGRAAAGGHRGQGQGGQVDAAQRAGRGAGRATDAGECTRVVTWYRDGPSPRILLQPNGRPRRAPLPVRRRDGALVIDLGDTPAERVDRLTVDWPSQSLRADHPDRHPGHRLGDGRELRGARWPSSTRTTTPRPRPTR